MKKNFHHDIVVGSVNTLISNFTSSSIAAVLPVGKQVGLDYLLSQV